MEMTRKTVGSSTFAKYDMQKISYIFDNSGVLNRFSIYVKPADIGFWAVINKITNLFPLLKMLTHFSYEIFDINF